MTSSQRISRISALAVLLLLLPVAVAAAQAFRLGLRQHDELPLRALLGDANFEALDRGEATATHYLRPRAGTQLRVPDFTVSDAFGQPFRIQDARGKVVVLNVWSETCKPCLEELPSLLELARLFAGDARILVAALSVDSGWPEVAEHFPERGHLKLLFDPKGAAAVRSKLGTRLYPETWVIDAEGIVRLRVDGARAWSDAVAIDAIRGFL